MENINFEEECKKIIKQCGLTEEDLLVIGKMTNAKNAEELYNELNNMLEKQIIKIK